MDQKKHRRFAPLQRYEDEKRAQWFLLGAGTVLLIYLIINLIF